MMNTKTIIQIMIFLVLIVQISCQKSSYLSQVPVFYLRGNINGDSLDITVGESGNIADCFIENADTSGNGRFVSEIGEFYFLVESGIACPVFILGFVRGSFCPW